MPQWNFWGCMKKRLFPWHLELHEQPLRAWLYPICFVSEFSILLLFLQCWPNTVLWGAFLFRLVIGGAYFLNVIDKTASVKYQQSLMNFGRDLLISSCLFYIYVGVCSHFHRQFAIFRKDLLWTKFLSAFFQFILNDCLKMGLLVSWLVQGSILLGLLFRDVSPFYLFNSAFFLSLHGAFSSSCWKEHWPWKWLWVF